MTTRRPAIRTLGRWLPLFPAERSDEPADCDEALGHFRQAGQLGQQRLGHFLRRRAGEHRPLAQAGQHVFRLFRRKLPPDMLQVGVEPIAGQGRGDRRPATQHVAGVVPQDVRPALVGHLVPAQLRGGHAGQHQQLVALGKPSPPAAGTGQVEIGDERLFDVRHGSLSKTASKGAL